MSINKQETIVKYEFIKEVQGFETGGNCPVDLVVLKDGRVIGINSECAVLYPSLDAFHDGDGDTLASFSMIEGIK